jgi:hypothetical protein
VPTSGVRAEEASAPPAPAGIRTAVLNKLLYDADYFAGILKLADQGRTSERLTPDEFQSELGRARRYQSVLTTFLAERAQYAAGKPFSLPPTDESFRVYTNLLSILNMLQAFERGDYAAARTAGSKVVVSDRDKLGLVRGQSTS